MWPSPHCKHKLSEVRADFLDRRWTPLPGARSAPGAALEVPPGGGPAPIQEIRADLRTFMFIAFLPLSHSASEHLPSASVSLVHTALEVAQWLHDGVAGLGIILLWPLLLLPSKSAVKKIRAVRVALI